MRQVTETTQFGRDFKKIKKIAASRRYSLDDFLTVVDPSSRQTTA